MESKPQGLRVSWVKFNIQAFNDILDAAFLPIPVCGEDVEVTERYSLSLFVFRVQPYGCWLHHWLGRGYAADAVPPFQYTGTHFADLGRMTG